MSARITIAGLTLLFAAALAWADLTITSRAHVGMSAGSTTAASMVDPAPLERPSGRPAMISGPPAELVARGPADHRPEPSDPQVSARMAELDASRVRAVERARSSEGLAGVLAELEARATRNGTVSAFEVEPGFAAIDASLADASAEVRLARRAEFSQRMSTLSARLTPRTDIPTAPGMSPVIANPSEGGSVP